MANVCSYHMLVHGAEKDCFKLLHYGMRQCYEIAVTHQYGTEEDYWMRIDGECRWSVTSSFIDDSFDDGSFNSKTLQEKSELLNLEIEVVGYDISEPDWLDHYHYKNGVCLRKSSPPSYIPKDALEEQDEDNEPIDLNLYEYDSKNEVYILKKEYEEEFSWDETNECMKFVFDMPFDQKRPSEKKEHVKFPFVESELPDDTLRVYLDLVSLDDISVDNFDISLYRNALLQFTDQYFFGVTVIKEQKIFLSVYLRTEECPAGILQQEHIIDMVGNSTVYGEICGLFVSMLRVTCNYIAGNGLQKESKANSNPSSGLMLRIDGKKTTGRFVKGKDRPSLYCANLNDGSKIPCRPYADESPNNSKNEQPVKSAQQCKPSSKDNGLTHECESCIQRYYDDLENARNERERRLNDVYERTNGCGESQIYQVRFKMQRANDSGGYAMAQVFKTLDQNAQDLVKRGANLDFVNRVARIMESAAEELDLEVDLNLGDYGRYEIKYAVPQDVLALASKWEDIQSKQLRESVLKNADSNSAEAQKNREIYLKSVHDLARKQLKKLCEQMYSSSEDALKNAVQTQNEKILTDAIRQAISKNDAQSNRLSAERAAQGLFAFSRKKELQQQIDDLLSKNQHLSTLQKLISDSNADTLSGKMLLAMCINRGKGMTIGDIANATGSSMQSSISEKVRQYTASGLIVREEIGRKAYFKLAAYPMPMNLASAPTKENIEAESLRRIIEEQGLVIDGEITFDAVADAMGEAMLNSES